MFKKLLLLSGVLVVCGWAFGSHAGREAVSYIKTGFKELRNSTKSVVPIGFELKRAEEMVNQLDRLDDKLISSLAQQITQLKRAEEDVETMTVNLDNKRNEVQTKHIELKTVKVAGNKPTSSELSRTLALENEFKALKKMEASLKLRQGSLENYQARVEALKKQREELKNQKLELSTKVTQLKTDMKYLEVAQMKSKHVGEDYQLPELGDLKNLLKEIEDRIGVTMTEHELRQGGNGITSPSNSNASSTPAPKLGDEIEAYFSNTKTAAGSK